MPIEVLLNFNGEGAFSAIQQRFSTVITELCQTVLANAHANLGGQYPEVESSLKASMIKLAEQGLIEGRVSADHWKSWMAEWGSGSAMDTSNPDLSDYMNSEYWNRLRDGMAISGRAEGWYVGLDGEMHYSSGKLAGENLEYMAVADAHFMQWMANEGLPGDAFLPKRPLHFMRNALLSNKNLILDQLNAVIETFDFGDFLV